MACSIIRLYSMWHGVMLADKESEEEFRWNDLIVTGCLLQ